MNAAQVSAGWYPDPSGAQQLRYWDGSAWTEHVNAVNGHAPQVNGAQAQVNGALAHANGAAPAAQAIPGAPQLALPPDTLIPQVGISGIEGMTVAQVNDELRQGAKFVVFPYVISLLIVTLRRSSGIYFVRPGESAVAKGLPFFFMSLVLGWWGFPWGFIFTPFALIRALTGGKNVTTALVDAANSEADAGHAAQVVTQAAAAEGPRSGVLQMPPAVQAQQQAPVQPQAVAQQPVVAQPVAVQQAPARQQPSIPAGWHPDPQGQARLRWWDGQAWTAHTQ